MTRSTKTNTSRHNVGPHYLTNRNYRAMTGDCPTHGPGVEMDTKGGCRLLVRERAKEKRRGSVNVGTTYRNRDGSRIYLPKGVAHELKSGKSCEICGTTENLKLDHCHDTGLFRGILCNNCNVGLGLLGDNFGRLVKAIDYLKRSHASKLQDEIDDLLVSRAFTRTT